MYGQAVERKERIRIWMNKRYTWGMRNDINDQSVWYVERSAASTGSIHDGHVKDPLISQSSMQEV